MNNSSINYLTFIWLQNNGKIWKQISQLKENQFPENLNEWKHYQKNANKIMQKVLFAKENKKPEYQE